MTIRAVNTGINQYFYNPQGNNLEGCNNDARNLVARFSCDHILLLDRQSTKHNVFAAWRAQRDKCEPGDTLLITHSSHGIPEGICCYDVEVKNGEWDPSGFISYPEISEFCREIPESILVEFLLDVCHASRGLRALGGTYGKGKVMRMTKADKGLTTPALVKPAKPGLIKPNVVLWSACEPNQTSADAYIDNQFQGAFTATFLEFEQKGRCRSDVIFHSRNRLAAQNYDQRPHLYCRYDKAMGMMR